MQIDVGDTFFIEPPKEKGHLYIVIVQVSPISYLLVNLTSSNHNPDSKMDCIITPSLCIHGFVVKQSTIAYEHATVFKAKDIQRMIAQGECTPHQKFPDEWIDEIINKGVSHKRLKNKYKKILKNVTEERNILEA